MAPRAVQIVISAAVSAMLMAGCGAGARASAELDRLRRHVIDLEKQTTVLQGRNTELAQALEDATRAAVTQVSPAVAKATPRLAKLAIGGLTHADDTAGDGRPDVLVVFISPTDGFGRFLQLVGTLSVTAAVVPPQGESRTIGRVTLDPEALRGAYRSTVLGTHYTVTVPIDLAGVNVPDCTVRVEFVDGYTGRIHSTYDDIDLEISP